MAKEIIMPKFGFTQEASTIVAWLKEEGQVVEKGEPICEVTTDKVNMEVEAPADGILGGIRFAEGATVPVTTSIAYVLAEGESAPATVEAAERAAGGGADTAPAAQTKATPVARRVAEAAGVNLDRVSGSGNRGKVTRCDVEA